MYHTIKAKKWDEWMSKRGQMKVRKAWVNLSGYRPKHRPDVSERCRVPVVAVRDDNTWCVLPYIEAAGEWIGGRWENVRRCCKSNLVRHVNNRNGEVNTDHKYKGIRFYYESDNIWMKKIKN